MLFLNLGVIAGVYAGTRAYQHWRARKTNSRAKTLPASAERTAERLALPPHRHQMQVSTMTLATTSVGAWVYPPLGVVNLGLLTYTTVPILHQTYHSLVTEKAVKNDALSLTVTGLCLATGHYFAASIQNWVHHLANHLVEQGRDTTGQQVDQVLQQQATVAWVIRQGAEIKVDVAEILPGDCIVIRAGERVPVDGVVMQGHALIDQQVMTGEATPVERSHGEAVLAETLVIGGKIEIQATHSGAESQAQRLQQLLRQTRDFKTQLQLQGEAWSDAMAKPLLLASGATSLVFGVMPAVALLFSAPTNTIRALLSLQTTTHLQWSTNHGILIKDGRALEELPQIDTFLFDKTGTLTETQPKVGHILACGGLSRQEVLRLAAAAEQHLHHPIAAAITAYAAEQRLHLPPGEDSFYALGLGVRVQIEGREVAVGSQRFIEELYGRRILPGEVQRLLREAAGHSFVFVAVDTDLVGVIELHPRTRSEAAPMILQLRRRGIQNIGIVSGDQPAPVQRLAQELGITQTFAEVKPRDKAALIRDLQQKGHRVCFVGDGINDALALKQANIGITLSSANEISRQQAAMILLDDRLTQLPHSLDIATHLHLRLGGHLAFWLSYGLANAALVPFGLTPVQASLLYGVAFTWGFQRAKEPGWLDQAYTRMTEQSRDPAEATSTKPVITGELIHGVNG